MLFKKGPHKFFRIEGDFFLIFVMLSENIFSQNICPPNISDPNFCPANIYDMSTPVN